MKLLPTVTDHSIDLILSDLPYGVTRNKADIPIDLASLWTQFKRVIRPKGNIVLTAQKPFSLDLIASNRPWYRYDLIWDKVLTTGFLNANRQPLRRHEEVLVFYENFKTYNPQKKRGAINHSLGKITKNRGGQNYGEIINVAQDFTGMKYPTSILRYSKHHPSEAMHPTEKPVGLFEEMVRTYSNKGDTVLDPCIGSGTTAVACIRAARNFIGMDISEKWVNISRERIKQEAESIERWIQ